MKDTRTEDRAPQGCTPSADPRAGMARGGSDAGAVPTANPDAPEIKLIAGQNGLDKGVHFIRSAIWSTVSCRYRLPNWDRAMLQSFYLVRQKNSWVDSGSGNLPSE